jgi:putative DNA primase/helicase
MAENLFERAKYVGASCIRQWLPDGRQNGDEWICCNPIRVDNSEGSFSINLKTGLWADFADSQAAGRDAVDLYAYLNRDRLEAKARSYKNLYGGLQAEAAKEILEKHDPSYFPGASDDFSPPKNNDQKKANFWAEYVEEKRGVKTPPPDDFSWYEKQWGKAEKTWRFTRDGRTVMAVCRFRDQAGKKEDRPFTIWSKESESRWRSKVPSEKYVIWNQDELKNRPNDPVLLFEGQKAAEVLSHVMTGYVCIGWFGGVNAIDKQDWSVLVGREVWFPFDGDAPGRKAIAKMAEIAAQHNFVLHPVYPPLSVPRGWDLADAVDEGWTAERIQEFLNTKMPIATAENNIFIDDDDSYQLRVLGFTGEHIAIYPYGQCRVVRVKPAGLTKAVLIGLQDKIIWQSLFGHDKGINWDDAQNYLIRKAESLPVFNSNCVRGAGAWNDAGELILNDGENIIRGAKKLPLWKNNSEYIYEKSKSIPYASVSPNTASQCEVLMDILNLISWKRQNLDRLLIAGWILLAPFCGALKWRPHLWITGAAGSGKTWVVGQLLLPMVAKEFGVHGKGTSTAAGVRNELDGSALPFVMDEMESDNQRQAETIEQILRLFREGSGGSDSATLHGGDGGAKHWNFVSMGAFASIGAAMKHGADKSRFVIVDMTTDKKMTEEIRARRFKMLEKLQAETVTQSYARGFVSRTISIWPQVVAAIDVFVSSVSDLLKSRRDGDRIGTLLAGSWMVTHDTAPTAAEAAQFVSTLGIESMSTESLVSSDEVLCFEEIMAAKIEMDSTSSRRTIGSVLHIWYRNQINFMENADDDYEKLTLAEIKRALEQYGIKIKTETGRLYIARNHPAIKRILRDTAWAFNYDDVLKRMPSCAELSRTPSRFAGIQYRFLDLDAEKIFGND